MYSNVPHTYTLVVLELGMCVPKGLIVAIKTAAPGIARYQTEVDPKQNSWCAVVVLT